MGGIAPVSAIGLNVMRVLKIFLLTSEEVKQVCMQLSAPYITLCDFLSSEGTSIGEPVCIYVCPYK